MFLTKDLCTGHARFVLSRFSDFGQAMHMPVLALCLVWGGSGQWAWLAQLVRCVTLVPKVQGSTPTSG